MSLVPFIAVIMIFAIPILGLLFAGYKEWLKFKAEHRALGTKPRTLEKHLDALRERLDHLEEERDALRKRVQNLETIVTSEAWIASHDDADASLDATEVDELGLPPDRAPSTQDTADHAAEIARRLRGK